jgi:hypothetical protein
MGPLNSNVMDTVFTMPVNAGNGPSCACLATEA